MFRRLLITLFDAKAAMNRLYDAGLTPLEAACENLCVTSVKCLLECGAEPYSMQRTRRILREGQAELHFHDHQPELPDDGEGCYLSKKNITTQQRRSLPQ